MPTFSNYLSFIFVTVVFVAIMLVVQYLSAVASAKDDWSQNRCNPAYWIYSTDVAADFRACIQSNQTSTMGSLMAPITSVASALADAGAEMGTNLVGIRQMMASMRENQASSFTSVFGVFTNVVIEIQTMTVSLKDMVGKLVGSMVAMLYILDGSIKTLQSTWNGPPGQMVRSIGSCFHVNTPVPLADGTRCPMHSLSLNAKLADGGSVFSVMRLANPCQSPFYRMFDGTDIILVTGDHFVYDKVAAKFVQVKDHPDASVSDEPIAEEFACLITTNRRIPIGDLTFWDWEDDDLTMYMIPHMRF